MPPGILQNLPTSPYFFYDLGENDYDTDQRLSLTARRSLTKRWRVSLSANPTYTKIDGGDGNWDYNGNFTGSYPLKRRALVITAVDGTEFQNVTVTS